MQPSSNYFYLFFEFTNGTDLENLKNARKRFSEQEAWLILKQLISAFQQLYERQIIHRDLKLANVLIHFPEIPVEIPEECHDDMSARLEYLKSFLGQVDLFNTEFEVKLADFGFAKQVQDMANTILGSRLFMAPEIMKGKAYNNQVDVWSLGVVFFEMLTGYTPFTGEDEMDLQNKIEKGVYRISKSLKLSLRGFTFLNGCLQYDSNKRLNWDQIFKHEFWKQMPGTEEELYLSFSEVTGHFLLEQSQDELESSMTNS